MITVAILINGQPIFARTAARVETAEAGDLSTYHLDTGEVLRHDMANGAVALAVMMLGSIREPGHKRPGRVDVLSPLYAAGFKEGVAFAEEHFRPVAEPGQPAGKRGRRRA